MKTKNIVFGGILAVIGLLMLINPGACINAVVVLVGLTAIAAGGYNLFYTLKNITVPEIKKMILIKSIVSIVIGLVAVICPFALVKTVTSIWKIISYVLAVYLILFAATNVYSSIKFRKTAGDDFKKNLIEGIICFLIAVLLFIIPIEEVGLTIVRVLGTISIIIGAVLIFVEVGIARRTTVVSKEDVNVVDDEPQKSDDTSSTEDTSSSENTSSEETPSENTTSSDEKPSDTTTTSETN